MFALPQTSTLAFSNSSTASPRSGLTPPNCGNFLFERLVINSTQSDDCQIETYCAVKPHAAYQSQDDVLWSVFFLSFFILFFWLGSQAFCRKRQVPVKRTEWGGPKISGATGELGDKSMRDADQSSGMVPVCSIGGSLDGTKNNTIRRHLFYTMCLLFQYWAVSRKSFTICMSERGALYRPFHQQALRTAHYQFFLEPQMNRL